MLKKEWQAILKNKFFIVVLVALATIPALYNLIFLSSMWDPYGKMADLPVAVVNQDKPATIGGKSVNLGQELVDELDKSHELDYHFVSNQAAQKGLKDDKYYLQITIPSDFSKNAGSLVSEHPTNAAIRYQTSKGHNFISSKMSDSAMAKLKAKVSENITATYTKTIFASLSELSTGMTDAATGSQKMVTGSNDLQAGSAEIGANLNKLATSSLTFKDGAATLNVGLAQYTAGVSKLSTGASSLSTAITKYTDGTSQLANGTSQLNASTAALSAGVSDFSNQTQKVEALVAGSAQLTQGLTEMSNKMTLSPENQAKLAALQAGIAQFNQAIQAYNTVAQNATISPKLAQDLTDIATNMQAMLTALQTEQATKLAKLKATTAYQTASADEQATLESLTVPDALQNTQPILAAVSDLQIQLQTLQAIQTQNQAAVAQLADKSAQIPVKVTEAVTEMTGNITLAKQALDQQLIPGAQQVSGGVATLKNALVTGADKLVSGVSQFSVATAALNNGAQNLTSNNAPLKSGSGELANGISQLNQNSAQLLNGTSQLTNGAQAISDGLGQLAAGENTLTDGIGTLKTGATTLATGLTDAKTKLAINATAPTNAEKIASPLKITHKDTDNSSSNGVGMAPYMISVALFVGAVATNMIIAGSLSGQQAKNRLDYLLGKLGVNGVIAVAEGVLVYGAVHLLGLSANHEVAMFGFTILVSLAFMLIVTFFNTWLGKPGAFLMLILLLLQLAASAGTYPLALTSAFFQKINPWLPMTYAVTGFRQVISLAGVIGQQTGIMLVLIAGFLVLLPLAGFKKAKSVG